MENKKVMIESMTNGSVSILVPELHLKRVWERKGAKKSIDFDVLAQAIYEPGVEYMFMQGILKIDDMDVKIELGLEPEGAKEPQNIIILSDTQKRRLLTVAPIAELKETVQKLKYEQVNDLVQFAIEKELANFERADILKQITNVDIIKAINLKRQVKQEN